MASFSEYDLNGFLTVEDVIYNLGLDLQVWKRIADVLGALELVDFPTIASIDIHEYADTLDGMGIKGIVRAKFARVLNAAREKAGVPLAELPSAARPPAPAPVEATVPQPAAQAGPAPLEGIVKDIIKCSQVFDQGCKIEVRPAPD